MKLISKILSLILITGALFFVLPETVSMFGWLDSGVISSYFHLIFPFNFILLLMSILSLYSFKKELSKDKNNSIFINNIIGLIVLILWLYFNGII